MYVCMLAYNTKSGTGRTMASNFSGQFRGTSGIILGAKNWD